MSPTNSKEWTASHCEYNSDFDIDEFSSESNNSMIEDKLTSLGESVAKGKVAIKR